MTVTEENDFNRWFLHSPERNYSTTAEEHHFFSEPKSLESLKNGFI